MKKMLSQNDGFYLSICCTKLIKWSSKTEANKKVDSKNCFSIYYLPKNVALLLLEALKVLVLHGLLHNLLFPFDTFYF